MGKFTAICLVLSVLTAKADDFDFYSTPEQLRQEPVPPPQLISPLEIEYNNDTTSADVQREHRRRSQRFSDKQRVDKSKPRTIDTK